MSDKTKQPATPARPDVPKPPAPKPDPALVTYIERGRKQDADKPRR
ncbi:MAG: hypothetical protein QNL12_07625 [Acidimicrobiia bacterium]|nr:hypothetical protein [Acidimicrobiia bacterium]MDX2467166.1 hypothetical protein [Acidimicrobiia bacterium]